MPVRAWLPGLCGAALLAAGLGYGAGLAATKSLDKPAAPPAPGDQAQATTLDDDLSRLAPQRPGHRDLFVLAFAGDGSETVFLNEVQYLRDLAAQRLDAAGRVIVLANHATAPPAKPFPEATAATLRQALAGLGERMDPDEDVLLAYFTTHGSEDHELLLRREDRRDRLLGAGRLRKALDDSGIRHRVIVVSACYAGGFIPALAGPDTLVLTAARHDRASFGCGNDSVATYFGRAWMVDGLNQTLDFSEAFQQARIGIAAREASELRRPSRPQLSRGARIEATLAEWRSGVRPGAPLPYPHAEPEVLEDSGEAEWDATTPSLPPADTSN